ncbi:hypothetical protein CGRA01v4_09754 [Colletotrichum graminicola]|nr:hypothetical protein CGRA01v4_09754 [Colletotrichum graminicola]
MPSRRAFSCLQRTAEACPSERPDDGGRAGNGLVLPMGEKAATNIQPLTVCLLATRRGSVLGLGGRGGAVWCGGEGKRSRDGRSRAGTTASHVKLAAFRSVRQPQTPTHPRLLFLAIVYRLHTK